MGYDADRIARNRKDILETRQRIESLVSLEASEFVAEERNALAVKYLLVQAVEAITDTCQHVLAQFRETSCDGYVDCIVKAGEKGIVSSALAERLRRLADLRNSLVHRYWIIDDQRIYELCRDNSRDFQSFVDEVERFVKRQ